MTCPEMLLYALRAAPASDGRRSARIILPGYEPRNAVTGSSRAAR